MSAKAEKIQDILNELKKNSEINNAAVVSSKGYMIASVVDSNLNEKALAAMTAALTSVAKRVITTLKAGKGTSFVLNGTDKIIIVYNAGDVVLIGLSPSDAKIGLIDYEMSSAVDKIKMVLG